MREAGERIAPITKTLTRLKTGLEKSGANAITKFISSQGIVRVPYFVVEILKTYLLCVLFSNIKLDKVELSSFRATLD